MIKDEVQVFLKNHNKIKFSDFNKNGLLVRIQPISPNKNHKIMRKLIDINQKDVEPLKILAVKSNKDLKNYIQDVLSEHVLKAKK